MFIRNTSTVLITQLMTIGLGLALSILLARGLGPDLKGQFDLVVTFTSLIALIANPGIGAAAIYWFNRERQQVPAIARTSATLLLASSIVITVLILLATPVLIKQVFQSRVTAQTFIIGALFTPLIALLQLASHYFIGLSDFFYLNLSRVLPLIIQIALVGTLWLVGGMDINSSLIAIGSGTGISVFLAAAGLWKKIPFQRSRLSVTWARNVLGFGIAGWLGNLLQYLNYRLDVFLVNFFLDPSAVAVYGIAAAMSETLWYLPNAVSTVLFPRTAADWDLARIFTPRVSRMAMLFTLGAGIVIAILGPAIIPILYSPLFTGAGAPLLALLPGTVLLAIGKVISSDLAGRGKPQFGTYAALASLVLTVTFDVFLIPRYGILGAGIASTLAYSTTAAVLFYLYSRLSGNPIASFLIVQSQDLELVRQVLHKWIQLAKTSIHKKTGSG